MVEQIALRNEDIAWVLDDIVVSATLTRPDDDRRRPAVLLVAGSGPTDRNWESPLIPGTNGSGRLYAEALARAGFVTLRYDKSGSGPNMRENVTRMIGKISMESHVAELRGGVTALGERSDVNLGALYALTNSEGAIHALHYQLQHPEHPFAGLVLTGVPGRSIADTMRSQIVPQLMALPDGEAFVAQYDAAVADYEAGRSVDLPAPFPETVSQVFQALQAPFNLPFARELMSADPAKLLPDITVPVLIVIGQKDIQANWEADGQRLEAAAAGKPDISFAYPPDANHVLKHEDQPREALAPAEVAGGYNAPDRVLDSEALGLIRSWLVTQAGDALPKSDPKVR